MCYNSKHNKHQSGICISCIHPSKIEPQLKTGMRVLRQVSFHSHKLSSNTIWGSTYPREYWGYHLLVQELELQQQEPWQRVGRGWGASFFRCWVFVWWNGCVEIWCCVWTGLSWGCDARWRREDCPLYTLPLKCFNVYTVREKRRSNTIRMYVRKRTLPRRSHISLISIKSKTALSREEYPLQRQPCIHDLPTRGEKRS